MKGVMSKQGFFCEKEGELTKKIDQTILDWAMLWHTCATCDVTPRFPWVLIFLELFAW
jgi:hypothetical protein